MDIPKYNSKNDHNNLNEIAKNLLKPDVISGNDVRSFNFLLGTD